MCLTVTIWGEGATCHGPLADGTLLLAETSKFMYQFTISSKCTPGLFFKF